MLTSRDPLTRSFWPKTNIWSPRTESCATNSEPNSAHRSRTHQLGFSRQTAGPERTARGGADRSTGNESWVAPPADRQEVRRFKELLSRQSRRDARSDRRIGLAVGPRESLLGIDYPGGVSARNRCGACSDGTHRGLHAPVIGILETKDPKLSVGQGLNF